MNEHNPWAYQSLTARMLETTRKGYWEASEEIKQNLAVEYAMNVINSGVACCDHTCNNPQLNQMVMNIISLPGILSPELAAEFKLAVEQAAQKSLEDQVRERLVMLKNLSGAESADDSPDESAAESAETEDSAVETVKGLKMEKVDSAEKTSISSSGVEWFGSLFVAAMVILFFFGITRKRR